MRRPLRAAVMLATDVALLVYRATARRADDATYVTRASSVYVRRDRAWTLSFHQQTPATR